MRSFRFRRKKAAIVTTGSEVYHGRIQDKFTPVVRQKLEEYGVEVLGNTICNDEPDMVTEAVNDWIKKGAQMVVCTGGMSVDPDDKTPLAIRNASDEVITYGAPVLPGAMFMLAYKGEIPIMGLPGCVMYARRTIFDLVLPRLVAGERLQDQDFLQTRRRRTVSVLRGVYVSKLRVRERVMKKERERMSEFYNYSRRKNAEWFLCCYDSIRGRIGRKEITCDRAGGAI